MNKDAKEHLQSDAEHGANAGEFRKLEPRKACRKDSGKLHRVKHGILSREVLHALVQVGEHRRTLRRLEGQYRVALRPIGPFGNLFFDRFWSSYLRLILVGRLEAKFFLSQLAGNAKSPKLALMPGRLPTLITEHPEGQSVGAISLSEELPPDLLRGLVLVQRYDRHQSREMYRALALLLLLRRGGEAGLESWATAMFGTDQPRKED